MNTEMKTGKQPPLQTVAHVDLARYAGHWYEYARYPNSFERKCAGEAQVQYTVRSAVKVDVRNECRTSDGREKVAKGWGKVTDRATNAKLRVTFFWPFFGDYWVIGLDREYRWAVVGEPKRRYLWVLTRKPEIGAETYSEIEQLVTERGYEARRLVKTPQGRGGG